MAPKLELKKHTTKLMCINKVLVEALPKGSALKNLNAENARFLLDHFADVGKMVFLFEKNGDLKSG